MTDALVLGVDCGGTATRAVLATVGGRIVGRGRARAGNPVAADPAVTAAALGEAAGAALHGHDPARVVGAVVGLAGVSRLAEPEVSARYAAQWARLGLTCPMRTVGDAVVAFAAGTAAHRGTVLIAGTGAVAAEVQDDAVGRTADGLGWLLGDEGSGFWLGLAAARSTARALYRGPPTGPLTRAVAGQLGSTDPDAFVTRVYQLGRDRLAGLAPLVSTAARDGDPNATAILESAAERLAGTLLSLHPAPGPVVLAGGVLAGVPEIRAAVQQRLTARLGRPGMPAGDAAAGAAWVALRLLGYADPALHARLLAAPPDTARPGTARPGSARPGRTEGLQSH
ncbi:N-acetylglucosamine kinase [Plantactinospora sp. BB1]|uniref:N-acetylglucosamine kinase n=1 Tax=Plantactinospora sp. BB1 TaxID=2071627 RepID=UPI000D151387|nr:BadF/BadG/BcrA/BcrD ATPase family protein [Plantactinospora sp. BB1]AVT37906.1 ATPase [Plantactinospora sp. BB1]